jgi:hypothetical protein
VVSGETVWRGGALTMKMRFGDRRRQRWGLGARGRREEGEGHGHLAERASRAALTRRGGDCGSSGNPGGGGGAPVGWLGGQEVEGARWGATRGLA